jgi:hypothetical protein
MCGAVRSDLRKAFRVRPDEFFVVYQEAYHRFNPALGLCLIWRSGGDDRVGQFLHIRNVWL